MLRFWRVQYRTIREACDDINQTTLTTVLNDDSVSTILTRFDIFLTKLQEGMNRDLAAFWMTYVSMEDIMLGLLRASREGNWELHSYSRATIPWAFAYDKINYARYMPVYYAQMKQLVSSHPDVHAHFVNGGFAVQRGSRDPFGKIPADQAIEETLIRTHIQLGVRRDLVFNVQL